MQGQLNAQICFESFLFCKRGWGGVWNPSVWVCAHSSQHSHSWEQKTILLIYIFIQMSPPELH